MMRVLFVNDYLGYQSKDPFADLVDVFDTSESIMKNLELKQFMVYRNGGCWQSIMKDGEIKHIHISEGRESQYDNNCYDLKYRLISGNR